MLTGRFNSLVPLVSVVVRLGIAALFLFAGLGKLRQPHDFLISVYGYQILGPPYGVYVAAILPHLEIVIAVCLLAGVLMRGAWIVATLLSTVFVLGQSWVLFHGWVVDCGCFGAGQDSTISAYTLTRTTLILLACIAGYWLCARVLPGERFPQRDHPSELVPA